MLKGSKAGGRYDDGWILNTHRCDISEHLSLKCSLDVSTVPLLLLHYVFPVRVWHNKAPLQHRQLSWRSLNSEVKQKKKCPFLQTDNHHHDWTWQVRMKASSWSEKKTFKSRDTSRKQRNTLNDLTVLSAHTHFKVQSWSYSPRPQLYATSSHQFLKVWHQPTSCMIWRTAEITSFSFPGALKQINENGLAQVVCSASASFLTEIWWTDNQHILLRFQIKQIYGPKQPRSYWFHRQSVCDKQAVGASLIDNLAQRVSGASAKTGNFRVVCFSK